MHKQIDKRRIENGQRMRDYILSDEDRSNPELKILMTHNYYETGRELVRAYDKAKENHFIPRLIKSIKFLLGKGSL